MPFKSVLICAAVVQVALSQCYGPAIGRRSNGFAGSGLGFSGSGFGSAGSGVGLAGHGYGQPCGAASASSGGGFAVTSTSPVSPIGVSVVSENAIEGALTVGGNLPLLGSVTLDGAFPTEGAGAVSYGCGDGDVGITSEAPIDTGILAPGPVAPAPVLSGPGVGSTGTGFSTAGSGLGFGAGCNGRRVNGLGVNGPGVNGLGSNCLGINGLSRGIRGISGTV